MVKRIAASKIWRIGRNQMAISIPKKVAEELKLKHGDYIIFYSVNGKIYIVRGRLVEDG